MSKDAKVRARTPVQQHRQVRVGPVYTMQCIPAQPQEGGHYTHSKKSQTRRRNTKGKPPPPTTNQSVKLYNHYFHTTVVKTYCVLEYTTHKLTWRGWTGHKTVQLDWSSRLHKAKPEQRLNGYQQPQNVDTKKNNIPPNPSSQPSSSKLETS